MDLWNKGGELLSVVFYNFQNQAIYLLLLFKKCVSLTLREIQTPSAFDSILVFETTSICNWHSECPWHASLCDGIKDLFKHLSPTLLTKTDTTTFIF